MTFFLIIVLIVGAIIAFMFLSDKNAGKDYGQIQRKVAASMYGMYVKDMPDPLDESRRIEAFIQAGIVGDTLTADSLSSGTYTGPLPERRDDGGWLSIYDNLRIL